MMTDTELRVCGVKNLVENLGMVEAERFLMLIQREKFDYTEWQRNLFQDEADVRAFSKKAQNYYELANK